MCKNKSYEVPRDKPGLNKVLVIQRQRNRQAAELMQWLSPSSVPHRSPWPRCSLPLPDRVHVCTCPSLVLFCFITGCCHFLKSVFQERILQGTPHSKHLLNVVSHCLSVKPISPRQGWVSYWDSVRVRLHVHMWRKITTVCSISCSL